MHQNPEPHPALNVCREADYRFYVWWAPSEVGKVKAKFGGSSAGHNGIESIDKFIGKDYSRVRIGIGRPEKKNMVSEHVLDNFTDDEENSIETLTTNITESLPVLIDKKLDLFSSTVNNK